VSNVIMIGCDLPRGLPDAEDSGGSGNAGNPASGGIRRGIASGMVADLQKRTKKMAAGRVVFAYEASAADMVCTINERRQAFETYVLAPTKDPLLTCGKRKEKN